MSDPLQGLTDVQREAAVHSDGSLLLLGGAGTGKTRALIARFGWLVEQGVAPERIALLSSSSGTAAALRARVESVVERAYEELAVATVPELCARLLRGDSRRRRAAQTASRFYSSASTSCRCAATTSRATRPRCSHRSSSASTG
jgi:superfamily I DNA/RNA helicase